MSTNVIEAVRKLALALDVLTRENATPEYRTARARRAMEGVNDLLATAEKPADESVATSLARIGALVGVPVTETQAQRDEVFVRVHDLAQKVAAAPPVAAVVPVKFNDDGDAMLPGSEFHRQSWGSEGAGTGWLARIFHAPSSTPGMRIRLVDVMLPLRPGEDAGETLAKMLAAVGRGP